MSRQYRVKAVKYSHPDGIVGEGTLCGEFDRIIEVDQEQGQLCDITWRTWLYSRFWPEIISELDPQLNESVRIHQMDELPRVIKARSFKDQPGRV